MNSKDCEIIDHINRNRNDNRKENLRIVSHTENQFNRSLNKNNKSGVSGVKELSGRWNAEIGYRNETIRLGSFESFEEAVKARLLAEQKYYGEYAPQKHLYEQYLS